MCELWRSEPQVGRLHESAGLSDRPSVSPGDDLSAHKTRKVSGGDRLTPIPFPNIHGKGKVPAAGKASATESVGALIDQKLAEGDAPFSFNLTGGTFYLGGAPVSAASEDTNTTALRFNQLDSELAMMRNTVADLRYNNEANQDNVKIFKGELERFGHILEKTRRLAKETFLVLSAARRPWG